MNDLDSKSYYNTIALKYNTIAKNRIKYLESVDNIIINETNAINSYLDIGAGNGLRSKKLGKLLKTNSITLVEESTEMIKGVEYKKDDINLEVINKNFLNFNSPNRYDLITVLWNVIGHLPTFKDRIELLSNAKKHLSTNGKIIIDVNNRLNMLNYGFRNVIKSIIKSIFIVEAGWFDIKENNLTTKVYIHNKFELKKIIKESGLYIEKIYFVNYNNGHVYKTFFTSQFKGQLVFILRNKLTI